MNRADELRTAAAECVALARTATDPGTRASLFAMAQTWLDLANDCLMADESFQLVLQDFNDRQMRG
jgi:hypothetical protein